MSVMPRVLEFGSSVAGGYCGRLLAMMGAEVIRVEPRSRRRSPTAPRRNPERFGRVSGLLQVQPGYRC